ncbi:thioredoxin domain-containing protein [Acidiplasma sp.]|nr:thioredoxin domain-containing protein [Acidiplasma sp.]
MNHLKNEKSPYLLEHANNPVDWYPWSDEAFNLAKSLDKPVFLSIGYSTCHWCHVMDMESFSDNDVAAKMNSTFVCIKVDREERPDIDSLYMTMSQILTGQGGWPLNMILTPDKKPIFAFTYIPKTSRNNMPGLIEICDSVMELWQHRRSELLKNADSVIGAIENYENSENKSNDYDIKSLIENAYKSLSKNFDSESGGFGSSPKFPSFQNLIFLMQYYKKYHDENALNMVEKTLRNMRLGGIYDQIGGGFHRYSTDSIWRIPHFEKMAYDQALAISAYSFAYSLTKRDLYKNTVDEIFNFVKSDMFNGAFLTAIDADSENEEGKYYLWDYTELKNLVDEDFMKTVDVLPQGNFYDAYSRPTGKNIIYIPQNLNDDEIFNKKFRENILRLHQARDKRIKPNTDDKILSDINGMMIEALSKAYIVFKKPEYLDLAENAADFIISKMYKDGVLMHRYRQGESEVPGFLDDYAFFASGLLYLYEATFNDIYLNYADDLIKTMIGKYHDKSSGGFYSYLTDLPVRLRESNDNAIPSGFSAALNDIIIESYIHDEYNEIIDNSIRSVASSIKRNPVFFTGSLNALFKRINMYKIETTNESAINSILKYYPWNYFILKKGDNKINVCDENKCYNIDESMIPKLINA